MEFADALDKAREFMGESRGVMRYRASEEVVYDDDNADQFIEWAEENAPELLTYKKPEPKKMDIKKAIKAGKVIEFAIIKTKKNLIIK